MIKFKDVSYKYNQEALKVDLSISNINLCINQGEFILISGKSGSGKTTLIRCINGLIPHFFRGIGKGNVFIEGDGISESGVKLHDIGRKVGSVFQDPRSQFFTTDTTAEVAFGCENYGFPREEMISRVEESFNILNIHDLKNRSVFNLSSGEKQKIAVASVHALKPKFLVLDEPSSNLDIKSTFQLAEILRTLKKKGTTIIIAEHRLYWLKDLVDKMIYLEEGKIVAQYSKEDILNLNSEDFIKKGLRQFDFDKIIMKNNKANCSLQTLNTIKVNDLSYYYNKKQPILQNISFKAFGGEIIGITGSNGCGKTTLAKCMVGLLKQKSGTISINEKLMKTKKRINNTYLVMQDADYQLYAESVEKELKLGNHKVERFQDNVDNVLENMNLSAFKERHPHSLSGGQKQRLTISVAFIKNTEIIIIDEPTSGLDGENMARLVSMLHKMAEKGKLVFVISHDYEFLVNCCTRIINIENGNVQEDFELNPNNLGKLKSVLNVITRKKEIQKESRIKRSNIMTIGRKSESWFSKQDPRNKMLLMLLISVLVFLSKNQNALHISVGLLFILMLTAKLYQTAVKFVVAYFIIYIVNYAIAIFLLLNPVITFISFLFFFLLLMLPIFMSVTLLINTTEVSELLGAMEAIHMPRQITIPFAVTLRFIPSLQKELGYIREAMKVRGIRLGIGHPIQSMEYILVPLLMRALKISEELSASAMTRGIDSPDPKTHFIEMKFRFGDILVMLGLILYVIMLFYLIFNGII
jgi:energy-coupling factor transport system ATP-binding protein